MSKAKRISERLRRRVKEAYDLVPLERAVFGWDHEQTADGNWPEEAFVVLSHDMEAPEVHELSSSTGADTHGWPDDPANNPGFVFGQLIFRRWKSREEQVEAIAEFAKIDALDWAREMLRGIAYDMGAYSEDDDRDFWGPIQSIEDAERYRDAILAKLNSEE